MPNRITVERIQMYLALEGHLPETFLLEEIFGLSPEKASQVAVELDRLQTENNPAVRSLHIAGRRRELRTRYGLPQVENEEITIIQGMTVANQIANQQRPIQGIRIQGSLGEILNSIFGGGGGAGGPQMMDPHDKPSNLGVDEFLKGFEQKPPQKKEEDDGEE